MSERMWRLGQFRFDGQIEAEEVSVFDETIGEMVAMGRDDAIALAHDRGVNLVEWWPTPVDDPIPACILSKVSLPLRWETVPAADAEDAVDARLWFEATCGGRDFLLDGGAHTFPGRMFAWCPDKEVSYRVSLAEMGEMSDESRYFVRGYLSAAEPDWPADDDGDLDPDDLAAWRSATRRFRETGSWYGRWGTCSVCGCVLLPDSAADRCAEHQEREPSGVARDDP